MDTGRLVLAEAVAAFQETLGERVLAAYALGSLAHGGFDPLVSDVDLGLVLADPLSPFDAETIRRATEKVRAGGSVLHERLSVFWGTPSTLGGLVPGGRFPPLDRLDLIESGLLLEGEDCRRVVARPGRDELLVAGAEFALDFLGPGCGAAASGGLGSLTPAGEDVMAEIRRPEEMVALGPRHLTKIVLFPVRFLFTAATGRMATNQAAVDHYVADGRSPSARLVTAALSWRIAAPDNVPATVELLEQELLPLYLHYIEDHRVRLAALGHVDLARAFEGWATRLDA